MTFYSQTFTIYIYFHSRHREINNNYAHSKYSISTISINNKALYVHRYRTLTVMIYLQTRIITSDTSNSVLTAGTYDNKWGCFVPGSVAGNTDLHHKCWLFSVCTNNYATIMHFL